MSDSSYIEASAPSPAPSPPSSPSEVDSLPSSPTTSSLEEENSDDEGESDAEREWKESLQQLELLLTMVVVPYVGKYFGRKCAYWGECSTCPAGKKLAREVWGCCGIDMLISCGEQVGLSSWNGNTRISRLWSRARRHSRARVLLKRRHLYNAVQQRGM